jgi:hypothetical protein
VSYSPVVSRIHNFEDSASVNIGESIPALQLAIVDEGILSNILLQHTVAYHLLANITDAQS